MMQFISALLAGTLFGLGLGVSGMSNPAKVIAFLDVTGDWDPTLVLVMGGALLVTGIGYRLVLRRPTSLLGTSFQIPTRRDIDAPLLIGSVLFGTGWGLVGLCPGPAVTALVSGAAEAFLFFAAMLAGFGLRSGQLAKGTAG